MPPLLCDHTRAFHSVRGNDQLHPVDASARNFVPARVGTDPLAQLARDFPAARTPHPIQELVRLLPARRDESITVLAAW